jgi:lipoprotein-releasing system permease protein
MRVAFTIAKRFLTYSKGQTLAIMMGIAIGVSVQIFIGLLITGLQTGLIDKTVGNSAHITITQVDDEAFGVSQSGFKPLDELTAISYAVDGAVWRALRIAVLPCSCAVPMTERSRSMPTMMP